MEESKTILFIAPVNWNYYPYRDQELPSMLASKGFQCIYLNPLRYKGYERAQRFQIVNQRKIQENITVIDRSSRMRKSLLLFIYENYLNYKTVKKSKPDAVINTDHLMSLFTCIYCRFRKIKFVFDVTDNWELVDRSIAGKFYKWISKPILARFAYSVTTTSQVQYNYFQKHRKTNTYLISNALPESVFKQLKDKSITISDSRTVNFVGSLRNWYDFNLLFEVFRHFPDITLNLYGQGELYNELLQKSSSFHNIKIHGNIDNSRVPALLNESLFGILPLKINELNNSTCPIKLFDYWGAAKPVIATPVAEIKRIAGDIVLYASTVDEFRVQISKLLGNRDLAVTLGKMGLEKVEREHNYHYVSEKFIELLKL